MVPESPEALSRGILKALAEGAAAPDEVSRRCSEVFDTSAISRAYAEVLRTTKRSAPSPAYCRGADRS